MIDTHCHVLPGLDDGPRSVAESLELAAAMVAQGVTHAVCTPHLSRRFPVSRERAGEALVALEEELAHEHVELALTLAAEVTEVNAVTLGPDVLREHGIRGRYLVVELAQSSTAAGAELLARRLDAMGLVPVFAHPERLSALGRDPASVARLRAVGGLVQVMASSLTGRFGPSVERVSWELLATGSADLVASDAHGVERRRCHLAEARERVCERLGERCWDELTLIGPTRLLESDA